MPDVSATEAARNFADLLDAVEHRGEDFTIVRRGKAIAHLEPVARGRGDDVKALLRRHRSDPSWRQDLTETRHLIELEVGPCPFCYSTRPFLSTRIGGKRTWTP